MNEDSFWKQLGSWLKIEVKGKGPGSQKNTSLKNMLHGHILNENMNVATLLVPREVKDEII